MKFKDDIKIVLIISFVVLEILSVLFNSVFTTITVGHYNYIFNYSIVFFCLGFFIVDSVNMFYSGLEANKFFYYKVYSQVIFYLLSTSAIHIYGIEDTQISIMIHESLWAICSGMVATYIGYKIMNNIMSKFRRGIYQGGSIFRRYIYSTLPGELTFSLVFSTLVFAYGRTFDEFMSIFISSCIAKIVLSIFFAGIISILFRLSGVVLENNVNYLKKKLTSV